MPFKRYSCPNCDSRNIVFSQRHKRFNCRGCGEEFKREKATVRIVDVESPGSEGVKGKK